MNPCPKPVRVKKAKKPLGLRPRKRRPQATPEEKAHLDAVAALGCLICPQTPEIHHVRTLKGKRIKRNHKFVLPLCPTHHRVEGGIGIGFHAGSRTWQSIHGTEEDLLELVAFRLSFNPSEEAANG